MTNTQQPLCIIGAGPVGMRCAQLLLEKSPQQAVVMISREPWSPYNRVRLSGFLSGEHDYEAIQLPALTQYADRFQLVHGLDVTRVDAEHQLIHTDNGETFVYGKLILATGSSSFLPSIPGIEMTGVYTFRTMRDVLALQSRQSRSRHTLVIGGGLLGLEAARAMRVYNTKVTVIEHSHHLMYQQLDAKAGEYLARHMQQLHIEVYTQCRVASIEGIGRVSSVILTDGREITCDTIIVAAGIRANLQVARSSGIAYGRGIAVNDHLQTNQPNIYAIGDCAEHDQIVYGLVAPGYEQAAVAVDHITGGQAEYKGSLRSTSLKVAGCPVFSMGNVDAMRDTVGNYVYEYQDDNCYRRLHIVRGRIMGALAIGEWSDKSRLQEAIQQQRLILPWQRFNFRQNGEIWQEQDAKSVVAWPTMAIVCQCTGVTRGQLSEAIEKQGCQTPEALRECTGASSVCGSCKPLLSDLLGGVKPEPQQGWVWLWGGGVLATLLSLIYLLFPGSGYPSSVISGGWDVIWREGQFREITGFSLLGTGVVISIISLRKRLAGFRWGEYSFWRFIHVVIAVFLVMLLWVHTGGRVGDNLNMLLMLSFTGLILAGGVLSATLGFEHHLSAQLARRLRRTSLWVHILLLWPLPVLLGFHILKAYYF